MEGKFSFKPRLLQPWEENGRYSFTVRWRDRRAVLDALEKK